MSCRPHALGLFPPIGCVFISELALYQACSSSASSSQANLVRVPARQAYSHWASVGRLYFLPSFSLSQAQNATASSQLTQTTGWSLVCSKPGFRQLAPASLTKRLPRRTEAPLPLLSAQVLYPFARTNAANCPTVTGWTPMTNGL